ncbi:nitrate- and nitrite sensing domain-containing protein [Reinekea blandensis]|uniref:Nitrate-and nitrite-responsive positive regulator n=1 Tax=Reinekea blandensis MED297 TaxID=314283 RepID=A4BAY8_9GAMM|nr:nitrate- and nitrite sensing domain-containing protein [Reinekea blandensis]EAR10601.1 nitrate-and nitrite-responsive positive regulator [Reinekea sp. MED297] [Reinekea blandensis MED297]
MSASTGAVLLHAKQLEIADLKALHTRAMLAGMAGHLIHCLQSERGASSIYIASRGTRFQHNREQLIGESRTIANLLISTLETVLSEPALANRKIANQLAWVILGLEAMEPFRADVTALKVKGDASVTTYSQLISVLINLIFELADTSVHPTISKLLVSLFSLVEGKELAGQERAVGALAFAGGGCKAEHQAKLTHLKENQERNFATFVDFCEHDIGAMIQQLDALQSNATFKAMRQEFYSLTPDTHLDPDRSGDWFDCCSDRISKLWTIQQTLVERIQQLCTEFIDDATKKLENSEELIQQFMNTKNQPPVEPMEFFQQQSLAHENSNFRLNVSQKATQSAHPLYDLVQQQSQQLAQAESDLQTAQQMLEDRKLIERAKGVLMAKMDISEEAAHRELRSSAMRHNQRLVEIADTILNIDHWG